MRIAITGGIAEGKSTVLGWLKEDGHSVSSSDEAARELFSDAAINERLASLCGQPFPISAGEVRGAILASAEIRRGVNRLMHPLVGERLRQKDAHFVEVPLLIEACLQDTYDEVWVVSCGRTEQRRRLMERYRDPNLTEALIQSQVSQNCRQVFADRQFRTNRRSEHVRASLREAVRSVFDGKL